MYVLTITFPKSDDASFDFDYFRSTHLPDVGRAFGPFGLGYAAVLRGEQREVAEFGNHCCTSCMLGSDIADFWCALSIASFASGGM